MNLAVLTSVETRHRYFVQTLAGRFDVRAVGYERTGYSPADTECHDLTHDERRIVAEHFAERTRQEEIFFGGTAAFLAGSPRTRVLMIEPGRLNSEATLELLESADVDAVAVYGTNLVRPPLLDRFAGRLVNMHLGLSPYYRGTATNFYPLLNEEPEYVGATIHLLDAGIDSGEILAHARPVIVADDRPHTIGCKAIRAGIEKLIEVLPEWHAGRRKPVPQWPLPDPRVYLRKHYHPRQVVALYRKLSEGLIPRYVECAAVRAAAVRLIE
jgi:hypothetical protein